MIATVPVSRLAPLEYRYALDAAMVWLADRHVLVRCELPELKHEVQQRIPRPVAAGADAALWIEPRAATWQAELASLVKALPAGAPIIIIASRPLARLIPERRTWDGTALGMQFGGFRRLYRALAHAGLRVDSSYGVHSVQAIGLNLLGQQAERWGRPDIGDRLHFAARRRYCATGVSVFSTVGLLVARKGHA